MTSLRLVQVSLGAAVLVSCTVSGTAEISEREAQWAEKRPAAYRIEVLHVESIWHAQTVELAVEGHEVTSASAFCTPAPFEGSACEVQPYDPDDFTVEGLFLTARALTEGPGADHGSIRFDDEFGYPVFISFDDPDLYDEDTLWRVTRFEPAH